MSKLPISFADVQAARQRIQNVAHVTPVLTSTLANAGVCQYYFKPESFQRTGAFKFRGAYNALSQFTDEQRACGVVTYSSGNHAQAIALSARLLGIPSVIVMPHDAPRSKLAATASYQEGQAGSSIVMYDRVTEDRAGIAAGLAADRGMTVVPPYDHEHVMAGQGTVALELVEQCGGQLDVLFVCVGGGGLLSGCAVAAKALCPGIRVVGVEPAAGDDVRQSLARGEVVRIGTPDTICDGAQTQFCGSKCFSVIRELVDEIDTVTDQEVVQTMRFFAERMKIFVEPTGCLAAAAAMKRRDELKGKRVGVIITGGNVDMDRFVKLCGNDSE